MNSVKINIPSAAEIRDNEALRDKEKEKRRLAEIDARQIVEIENKIKEAVANGVKEISGNGWLSESTQTELKKLGYKYYEVDRAYYSTWSVSWYS